MKQYITFGIIALLIYSCGRGPNDTGREYIPDMTHSVAYEPYTKNPNFSDSMTARTPVKGTVPRGNYMPYHYENNIDGYEKAGMELKNPLAMNEANLAEGKRLYTIYCAICHGANLEADGIIVANGKFPPPTNLLSGTSSRGGKAVEMPEGKVYHTMMYGVNLMGSYASQIDHDQRWKIVQYVKSLQNDFLAKSAPKMDSTATAKK